MSLLVKNEKVQTSCILLKGTQTGKLAFHPTDLIWQIFKTPALTRMVCDIGEFGIEI